MQSLFAQPGSTTDFVAAFEKTFDILAAGVVSNDPLESSSSGCAKAILFMSDGTPDSWGDAVRLVGAAASSLRARRP